MRRQDQKVDFPCGQGGYNASENPYTIPPTDLIVARNIRYDGEVFVKAPGLSAVDANTIASNNTLTCVGGHSWNPAGTTKQITVWSNGNVYKEASGDLDSVTIHTGWNATQGPAVFVEGGDIEVSDDRELYLFGEYNLPKKLVADAGSMVNITATASDWSTNNYPTFAFYHNSRIIAGGNGNAPHVYYISTLNDHGDFNISNGARAFELAPGFGERLVAGYSHLPERVYFWKYPKGIFYVDTTDISALYLPTALLRSDVGAAGPHCVTKVDDDLWFVSANGRIYSMNALRPDTDLKSSDITALYNLERFIENNVDKTALKWARLVYDETRREVSFYFTSTDGVINDRALVFDLNKEKARISIEERRSYDTTNGVYRSYFHAVWPVQSTLGSTVFYAAGNTGKVYELNNANRSVDGEAYLGEFQTPDTDLGPELGGIKKHFTFLEITLAGTGSYDLLCDVYVDGRFQKTLSLPQTSSGDVFDTAVFGEAVFGQSSTIDKRRRELDLHGETISLKFYNSGENENFKVRNVRVYFRTLGDIGEETE